MEDENRIVKIKEPNHIIYFRNKTIRTPASFCVTEEELRYIQVLIKARGITSYEISEVPRIKELPSDAQFEKVEIEESETFGNTVLENLISESVLEKVDEKDKNISRKRRTGRTS